MISHFINTIAKIEYNVLHIDTHHPPPSSLEGHEIYNFLNLKMIYNKFGSDWPNSTW